MPCLRDRLRFVILFARDCRTFDLSAPYIYSAEMVLRGKPFPDLFLHAANQLGHAPVNCLVIEDGIPGVQAGRTAGRLVLGFVGGSHCEEDHEHRLIAAGAELVFRICANCLPLSKSLMGHSKRSSCGPIATADRHGANAHTSPPLFVIPRLLKCTRYLAGQWPYFGIRMIFESAIKLRAASRYKRSCKPQRRV